MDILLDLNTHDAIWRNGPLRRDETTQPFTETVGQRLKIRLLTFKPEWVFNIEYGVPYLTEILGFKRSKQSLDLIFQQQILLESGVKEIVSFTSSFENRNYSATFQVRVVNGEVTAPITVTPIS